VESWLLKILPYLVETLIEDSDKENCTPSSESFDEGDLAFVRLSILNNLCRNNPPVIKCLEIWTKFEVRI